VKGSILRVSEHERGFDLSGLVVDDGL